ncbi:MAG: Smr/MutS family protein [Bacteroidaceae bacterium]|nr:Smr/MutS family protein [Bacteroidaceae bacterium]
MIYPHNFEKKIEFDAIRTMLKEKCLSTMGRERVDEMQFMTDFDSIEARLNETEEFMRLMRVEQNFPNDFYYDVREPLHRIRIQGMYLNEEELFALRRSLDTIGRIAALLHKRNGEGNNSNNEEENFLYPCLQRCASDVQAFPRIIRSIDAIVDKFGHIKDNASPTLARIRSELVRTSNGISRTLNSILRQAQADGLVEKDATPTLRDGRLVIPVAPALKRKMGGIVHDESASGKTVFIEPAEVVMANNRIRELEAEEKREVILILTNFSDTLRPEVPQLLSAYDFLGVADFIRAKAQLAEFLGAIKPILNNRPMMDFGAAYHPLLELSLRKHGRKMSPLDIELESKERRILLISGPNAGGKSVCLKTAGLLQYMLQCGMPIPVHERSRAGIFHSMFIDIGDQQSIEDDLSTYSSHLLNMKHTLRNCDRDSLILIDEFGNGTEPLIGGAMAEAILKRFNNKGAFGIITTHYQNLKHFADSTPGVVNGAMLYDRAEMRPLFILQAGNPGSSFAVEIARKIGLPEEIIKDASEIVGSDYIQSDKYLQDIVRDKRYWENKRRSVHQKEKELDEMLGHIQESSEELKKSRKQILKEARDEGERLLREANARIENTIRSIVEAKAEKERTRQARRELEDFGRKIEELARREQQMRTDREMEKILARQERKKNGNKKRNAPQEKAENATLTKAEPQFEMGNYVRIIGQQAVGEIMSVNRNCAMVRFGAIKSTVSLARLELAEAPKEEVRKVSFLTTETQENLHNKRLNFKSEIDIRGMRGEEALQAVTYFLDDATVCGVNQLRILHGTGNGILRTLVRQYLSTVPTVRTFHDEHVQFGGAGITVIELER